VFAIKCQKYRVPYQFLPLFCQQSHSPWNCFLQPPHSTSLEFPMRHVMVKATNFYSFCVKLISAMCEFENQPQKLLSQPFRKWFWIQKSILNPTRVVQTSFDGGLFSKTCFCVKKCAVFGQNCIIFSFLTTCNFRPKNNTFFSQNPVFF
jgi:hypothetical protein